MTTTRKKAPGNANLLKPGNKTGADKITDKMRLFVVALKEGKNLTQSAVYAGYPENSAHSRGNALRKHWWVVEQMDAWFAAKEKKTIVTHDRITEELEKWAFTPVTEFIEVVNDPTTKTNRVQFKETSQLNPVLASMVKSLKVGKNGIVEMTFKSSETAMDMLAKHVGYFKEDNEQKKDEGVQIYMPDNGRDNAKINTD